MVELRVAVGVIRPLLGLPIPLQAVVQVPQELGDLLVADRVLLRRSVAASVRVLLQVQRRGDAGITARQRFHQGFQPPRQRRIVHDQQRAAGPRPANPPGGQRGRGQLPDALRDRHPGQATGALTREMPP